MDAANALLGRVLFAHRDEIIKEKGSYFIDDLLGLKVTDADTGEEYGNIYDVIKTGANDVYALKDTDGKERFVPAIKDVIVSTDIAAGEMKIRPLRGLFDED